MLSIQDVVRKITADACKGEKLATSLYLSKTNYEWLEGFSSMYPKANPSRLVDEILNALRRDIQQKSDQYEEMHRD